jgi:hypothetical protein
MDGDCWDPEHSNAVTKQMVELMLRIIKVQMDESWSWPLQNFICKIHKVYSDTVQTTFSIQEFKIIPSWNLWELRSGFGPQRRVGTEGWTWIMLVMCAPRVSVYSPTHVIPAVTKDRRCRCHAQQSGIASSSFSAFPCSFRTENWAAVFIRTLVVAKWAEIDIRLRNTLRWAIPATSPC